MAETVEWHRTDSNLAKPLADGESEPMSFATLVGALLDHNHPIEATVNRYWSSLGLDWGTARVQRDSEPGKSSAPADEIATSQRNSIIACAKEYSDLLVHQVKTASVTTVLDGTDIRDKTPAGEFQAAMAEFAKHKLIRANLPLPKKQSICVVFETRDSIKRNPGLILPIIGQIQIFRTQLEELFNPTEFHINLSDSERALLLALVDNRQPLDPIYCPKTTTSRDLQPRTTLRAISNRLLCNGPHQAAIRALLNGALTKHNAADPDSTP